MENNVISLRPRRRTSRIAVDRRMATALAVVAVETPLFAGLAAAFLLTRAAAGDAWPPAGQPWFPAGETAVNTALLLGSGALIFRAARSWEDLEARIAPALFAAILLGAGFLLFQSVVWVGLVGHGLDLGASHHGRFFCLIVALHAAHCVGALALLAVVWLRLAPFREDGPLRREPLRGSAFSAARVPWYFAVASWPILYLTLFL